MATKHGEFIINNNVKQNGDDEMDERFKRLHTLLEHFWKRYGATNTYFFETIYLWKRNFDTTTIGGFNIISLLVSHNVVPTL